MAVKIRHWPRAGRDVFSSFDNENHAHSSDAFNLKGFCGKVSADLKLADFTLPELRHCRRRKENQNIADPERRRRKYTRIEARSDDRIQD